MPAQCLVSGVENVGAVPRVLSDEYCESFPDLFGNEAIADTLVHVAVMVKRPRCPISRNLTWNGSSTLTRDKNRRSRNTSQKWQDFRSITAGNYLV